MVKSGKCPQVQLKVDPSYWPSRIRPAQILAGHMFRVRKHLIIACRILILQSYSVRDLHTPRPYPTSCQYKVQMSEITHYSLKAVILASRQKLSSCPGLLAPSSSGPLYRAGMRLLLGHLRPPYLYVVQLKVPDTSHTPTRNGIVDEAPKISFMMFPDSAQVQLT